LDDQRRKARPLLRQQGERHHGGAALAGARVTVIDVGLPPGQPCTTTRGAFASLEEAFDPVANARYAGLFLTRLRQGARDWETAASHYHSQTPERAEAYRLKVLAAWPGMAHRVAAERQRDAIERQRDAVVAAWGGGDRASSVPATGDGFQAVALSLSQRGGRGAADRGLLDPVPVQPATRRAGAARARLQQVAEAPRRR
jgi:hypothetical protein